jgi:hypothetical protein
VLTAAVVLVMAAVPSRNGHPADIDRWGCCCAQCYIVSACSNRFAPTLRKKLRKYPGLNTPLGIPGVLWCIPTFGVFLALLGVFRMVYSQSNSTYTRYFRPKTMPPVHALELVLVANAPRRTYWEWGQLGSCGSRCGSAAAVPMWYGSAVATCTDEAPPSPTRGALGYFQWGISLPLGRFDMRGWGWCALGYSQWGISLPSRRDNSAQPMLPASCTGRCIHSFPSPPPPGQDPSHKCEKRPRLLQLLAQLHPASFPASTSRPPLLTWALRFCSATHYHTELLLLQSPSLLSSSVISHLHISSDPSLICKNCKIQIKNAAPQPLPPPPPPLASPPLLSPCA